MADTEGSVLRALELAEPHAFYASRVGWPAVRVKAMRRVAAGASTIGALKPVWEALDDHHSHVRPPAPRHGVSSKRVTANPSGELRDTVAYLRLPPIRSASTGPEGGADYVRTAAPIVRENWKARAWLVDLRGNTGGTIHPMLAAAGPLLGPGTVLSYRRRASSGARFTYLPEGLLVNDRLALPASPDLLDLHDVPDGQRGRRSRGRFRRPGPDQELRRRDLRRAHRKRDIPASRRFRASDHDLRRDRPHRPQLRRADHADSRRIRPRSGNEIGQSAGQASWPVPRSRTDESPPFSGLAPTASPSVGVTPTGRARTRSSCRYGAATTVVPVRRHRSRRGHRPLRSARGTRRAARLAHVRAPVRLRRRDRTVVRTAKRLQSGRLAYMLLALITVLALVTAMR